MTVKHLINDADKNHYLTYKKLANGLLSHNDYFGYWLAESLYDLCMVKAYSHHKLSLFFWKMFVDAYRRFNHHK